MTQDWLLTCLLESSLINVQLDFQHDTRCVWFDQETLEPYLVLEKENDWMIVNGSNIRIEKQPLQLYHLYTCYIHNCKAQLFFEPFDIQARKYTHYKLPESGCITIGRKKTDILYNQPNVSAHHASIRYENDAWFVIDMQSGNGVYVNCKRIYHQPLTLGDCIYIMGLQILMGNGWISINNPKDNVKICEKKLHLHQPLYTHGERNVNAITKVIRPIVHTDFQFENQKLLNPIAANQQDRLPLLFMLGPSFTMGIASLSSALFTLQNAITQNLPMSSVYPSLIMAGSMMAGTIVWPFLTQRYERKREEQLEKKRVRVYETYLHGLRNEQMQELQAYESWLWMFHCRDIDKHLQQIENLWKHVQEFERGFTICLGICDQKIHLPLQCQKKELQIHEDPLIELQKNFMKESLLLRQVPFYLHSNKHSIIHVEGTKELQISYQSYLILHFCAHIPPGSVQLVFAYANMMEIPREFRYLPHLFDEEKYRYIAHNQKQARVLAMRLQQRNKPALMLSFSAGMTSIFHSYIEKDQGSLIFAFHDQDYLDEEIARIHLTKYLGSFIYKDSKQMFTWYEIQKSKALARQFANINYIEKSAYHFPTCLGFLEMFHAEKIAHLQIWKRWHESHSYTSLAVPLGVHASGEDIILDLHERAHGPHGIIAGMTGSGKSEWLLTLLLSLAVSYHPDDVAFILIDYKGGGMAKSLEQLPHIAGIITNLDGSMIQRSLNSLDSELIRRQTIFSNTMQELQISSIDIYVYQQLYHENLVKEPLPHLIIVADEFAELKQQQPQFMEQLIRMARIGRSLGIHLLLATQKPSGVVDDQIWSNARFHICLKVADKADSMDMLKREDGALLKDTGRFFLQVGYNEIFEEGQSAYAKLAYDEQKKTGRAEIRQINANGEVLSNWKRKTMDDIQKVNELQAIVEHIHELANQHGVHTRQLWLDPLPEKIALDFQIPGMIAMIDDPLYQRQIPFIITLEKMHNLVFYSMNLREVEQLLSVMLYQYCQHYACEELRILIFDFDQRTLCSFYEVPHVYASLCEENSEDIHYLERWLYNEIKLRKKQQNHQKLLLIIHHTAAFLEQYENYESLLYMLARDGERYGIFLYLSAVTISDIRYRIQQQFSAMFVFHLHDDNDFHSLIPGREQLPSYFGRGYYKQNEIYEIQVVEHCIEMNEKRLLSEKASKLQRIPEHIVKADVWHMYNQSTPYDVPIGMNKETRSIVKIHLDGIWVISGTGGKRFYEVLQEVCKEHELHIEFVQGELSAEFQQEAISAGKSIVHFVPISMISTLLYGQWFQSVKEQGKFLWVGDGLQEIRYQIDVMQEVKKQDKQDGYRIQDDIEPIRFLEMCNE